MKNFAHSTVAMNEIAASGENSCTNPHRGKKGTQGGNNEDVARVEAKAWLQHACISIRRIIATMARGSLACIGRPSKGEPMTQVRKHRSALLVALLLSAGIGFAGVAVGADNSSSSGASAGAGTSSGAGAGSDTSSGMGGSAAGTGGSADTSGSAGTGASSGMGTSAGTSGSADASGSAGASGSTGTSPGAAGTNAGGSNAGGTLPPPGGTTVPPATGMRKPSTTAPAASDTPSMAFRKLDQGSKGYVTVDDASTIPGFGKAFQDNDVNHDGRLDAQEFSRAWAEFSNR